MNKDSLVLHLEDWDMSSRVAKISSDLSIDLMFYEKGFGFDQSGANYTFIIDVKILSENDFRKLQSLSKMKNVFIIGYIDKIDAARVKSLNRSGFDIVLKRNELLKNLKKIIYKAIN